jgi:hypothetical protein
MALDFVVVYQSVNKKIRVGSENDGGYVIADGLEYDCLISCGVANDITFEVDFLKKYPNTPCFCYDGTVDGLPEEHAGIQFIKKNISYFSSDQTTTLVDLFERYDNIFLKMDIESYEYRWLQVLSPQHCKKIKQLVIEFHFPWTDASIAHFDAPLPIPQKVDVLRKLYQTHTLIHLHANNCCGVVQCENMVLPNVFECTYVRKDVQPPTNRSSDIIPGPLDRPNISGYPDITLYGYPFVSTATS